METGQVLGTTLTQCTVLEGDKEPPDIRPFELYLVLQVSVLNEEVKIGTLTSEFYQKVNLKISLIPGIHKFKTTSVCNATTTRKTISTSKLSRMV